MKIFGYIAVFKLKILYIFAISFDSATPKTGCRNYDKGRVLYSRLHGGF
jgi:hypothetical protein